MKIDKLIIFIFLFVILIFSWRAYLYFNPNFEKCFKENNENFKLKIQRFNIIANEINKLNLKEDYNIPITEFPNSLKNKLEELGIDSISYLKIEDENCESKHIIELNVIENWNIKVLNNVKLIYSPCDKNTKLNFHSFDGYHIDVYGQGENWLIISDTDFI